MLFYMERSLNKNVVIYELNVNENNKVNKENPIKIYWRMDRKNNPIENLSYLERTMAYGCNIESIKKRSDDSTIIFFTIVSLKDYVFCVKMDENNHWSCYILYESYYYKVNHIFIQLNSYIFTPSVEYIKLFLTKNKKNLIKYIYP